MPQRFGPVLPQGDSMAYLELLLFGLSPADSLALEKEWKSKLQQLFPEK